MAGNRDFGIFSLLRDAVVIIQRKSMVFSDGAIPVRKTQDYLDGYHFKICTIRGNKQPLGGNLESKIKFDAPVVPL